MAGAKIALTSTTGELKNDGAGNALVNMPGNSASGATVGGGPETAGHVTIQSENDPGVATGERYVLSPETSDDYRLRVGRDSFLDNETFNYTNQNTAKFGYTATTLVMALSGGFLVTNNGAITTTTTAARLFTWRYYPLFGQQTPTYFECSAAFSQSLSGSTNTVIDFGAMLLGAANPYAPTDGVFFRASNAGVKGVAVYNGTESATDVFTFTPNPGQVYQYLVAFNEREAEFWIDDVLYGTIETPTGQGQPCMSSSLPFGVRHAIVGGAAGNAQQLKLADFSVMLGDVDTNRPWGAQMTSLGGAPQVQPAASTGGQLSTYALGAAPGAVTLTASTAPATNTLGGLFLLPAAITAGESDYPLFAWQCPAGTAAVQGKTFWWTGVIVSESFIATALTGGPLVLLFSGGFGSTAASLATTESTTFASGTTKIARKFVLGAQSFAATAAVGVLSAGFQRSWEHAPIPINPGEFLHIILRCIGTNTTAGAIRGGITPIGYFE